MTEQRLIIRMGLGVDPSGQDATAAAVAAVRSAVGQSALPILDRVNTDTVRTRVTIAIPEGFAVTDAEVLAQITLPGSVDLKVVSGGLVAAGGAHLVANAAVEVFLPNQHT